MTRGRWIAAMVAILLLFAAWIFGSPYWTLHQMREAARDRDADALARYIDFPELRESLKTQLRAQLLAEAERTKASDALSGAGMRVAMAFVDPMIDGLLTPEALRVMFLGPLRAESEADPAEEPRAAPFGITTEEVGLTYGVSEFQVRTGEAPDDPVLLFTRHGLSWKLTGIRIPAGRMARAEVG